MCALESHKSESVHSCKSMINQISGLCSDAFSKLIWGKLNKGNLDCQPPKVMLPI